MLKGVEMGYLRTKTADFVLRSRKKRYLRTKTADFVLTMAKGPFTLFSPSPLKLFISYGSSIDQI